MLSYPQFSFSIRLFLSLINADKEDITPFIKQASDNNWSEIISLADHHGLAPYIFYQIEQQNINLLIPDYIIEKLRQAYLSNAIINMRIYHDLTDVLKALRAQQIPIIPLKGIFLAEKVYENIALRVMSVIDLLLPRSSLSKALEILSDLNYRPTHSFDLEEECRNKHSLPPLLKPGSRQIDLHWTISAPVHSFRIPIEQLWKSSKPDCLAGIDVLKLSPENLLLHLTHHFAFTHLFWYRLFQVIDIYHVLQHYKEKIDWELIEKRASEWRIQKSVFLALKVAHELIRAPVPISVLQSLEPVDYQPQYLEWMLTQILTPPNFSINLAEFWSAKSRRERIKIFIKKVFYPPRVIQDIYPRFGRGLGLLISYPYRVFDVTRRHFHGFLRLIKGDPKARYSAEQLHKVEQLGIWLENQP